MSDAKLFIAFERRLNIRITFRKIFRKPFDGFLKAILKIGFIQITYMLFDTQASTFIIAEGLDIAL